MDRRCTIIRSGLIFLSGSEAKVLPQLLEKYEHQDCMRPQPHKGWNVSFEESHRTKFSCVY